MSYRYRNTQSVQVRIPDAGGVEVDPGQEFDCEELLNNPTLVPADAATQAAQDARDAAAAAELAPPGEPLSEPAPAPKKATPAPAPVVSEPALAPPDATPQEAPAS